mgnify:CR=1 FL=1
MLKNNLDIKKNKYIIRKVASPNVEYNKEEFMYKLVAIDLDGTMLNSYGEVTTKTKEVIKKCIDKGVYIILASGRPIDSIKSIAREIESQEYFIAGNGALVYDMKEDKIIYENYMKKEKVLEIIKICEENSIAYNVYTDRTIITSSLKFNVLYYYKENLKKEEDKKTNISIVENVYEYVKNMEEEKFLKITICDENSTIFNSIIKKVKEINEIDVLEVSHMSRKLIEQGTEQIPVEYFYTEITASDVDKWKAIEFLIKKLEINPEQVMAIGDNMNDKKMIENAGLGVAIKGSTPQVIAVAKYVTDTNNHDGVAKVLERYIL